jgi:hypothetical protein
MKHGSPEHVELIKEAFDEHGVVYDPGTLHATPLTDESAMDVAIQSAEADLTYTESGFLTSYEWGISLEDPSPADLYKFIKGD